MCIRDSFISVDESTDESRLDGESMALAVLAPNARPHTVGKPTREVDINFFHVSLAHANEALLRATAEQQGITLTGTLQPCSGCLEAKGRRAGIPRHLGLRASTVLGIVHLDLTGPHPRTLGGSTYMLACVDSKSRFMMLYGLARKADTLAKVKRYIADVSAIGSPQCFRMDNGGEFTSAAFAGFCDESRIRREYTAPDTPKHNAVAENAIWRVMKAGHAARREAFRLFPDAGIEHIPHLGKDLELLWLEAAVWAADGFNRSATTANPAKTPPYRVLPGRLRRSRLSPSFNLV